MNIKKNKVNSIGKIHKKEFTPVDVVQGLVEIINKGKFEVSKTTRFSIQDFIFIASLIFKKNKNFMIISMLDYLNKNGFMGLGISNTATLRRIIFFQNFIGNKGNARKAAISAGYSPRCAKQQGYRVLKWIQKSC